MITFSEVLILEATILGIVCLIAFELTSETFLMHLMGGKNSFPLVSMQLYLRAGEAHFE